MKDLISVIIPFYNSETYIKRCLDSVFQQTYTNFECILINDGSTDDAPKLAQEYCNMDSRFKLINKSNSGVSDSRNIGLQNATGEYIVFVDSDDWIDNNFLEVFICKMENDNCDLVSSAVLFEKNSTKEVIGYKKNEIVDRDSSIESLFKDGDMRPVVWGKMYRRSFLKKNNISFDTNIAFSEDVLFVLEVLLKSSRIGCIAMPLYHYFLDNDFSAQNSYTHKKHYNHKWDSMWTAYSKMESLLQQEYSKKSKVFRTFVTCKTEAARNLSRIQNRYGVHTNCTDSLRSFVKKNWLLYCREKKDPKKTISMLLYILFNR